METWKLIVSVLMCMPVILSGGNAAVDVAAVVLVAAGGETVAVVLLEAVDVAEAADVVAVVPVVSAGETGQILEKAYILLLLRPPRMPANKTA